LAFEALFGDAPPARVSEVQVDEVGNFVSATSALDYALVQSLRLFFGNGGDACYIVSVGSYKAQSPIIERTELVAGVEALGSLDEPTLLVCPDAALLDAEAMAEVQQAMLRQCSHLQDRFAVLDTRLDDALGSSFRANIGADSLRYGAAYTPWLKILQPCRAGYAGLRGVLKQGDKTVTFRDLTTDPDVLTTLALLEQLLAVSPAADIAAQELWLAHNFTAYRSIISGVLNASTVACPASGAVTGVYAAVDRTRGVWKAPANVALTGVLAPMAAFDTMQLEALNVDTTAGKSINAIRAFSGKGTLIWGARTLAGNDNEWRYVSVRRFFIMVEESLKKSTASLVFEPNEANTWIKVRGMIENYLTQKWRHGALAGAKPEHAFFVSCGIGQTMTPQDVLEGRLIVEIGMSVVRPAEFIILRFSQTMQSL
jgi:phage tail sheath protein FI